MKIQFSINYYTQWGQNLYVTGNIPELGNNDKDKALAMQFSPTENWSAEIILDLSPKEEIQYSYFIKDDYKQTIVTEWGKPHRLHLDAQKSEVICIDAWNSISTFEHIFMTEPFDGVFYKHEVVSLCESIEYTHIFKVRAPLLNNSQVVCIVGDCEPLGNWNTEKPLLLNYKNGEWYGAADLTGVGHDIHYKYGVFDIKNNIFQKFENGVDRSVLTVKDTKYAVIVNDLYIRQSLDSFKGTGVSIPVFSLRSKSSFGCGDFSDLKLMVDWAVKTDLKLIQLLPLNDTVGTHTQADVLPYAAISAFALNPLFLDLKKLPLSSKHPFQKEYEILQPQFNAEPLMDYLPIINFKLKFVKASYLEQKTIFLKNKEFQDFYKVNEYWLKPYSVYCCLRDKKETCDYSQWGDFAVYDEEKIKSMFVPSHAWFDDVAVNWYIQYQLHLQLTDAVAYAHSKKIVIKGDIPIGVNRFSVDTWVFPKLFNMDMQAGAPPDMFAVKGQNWELPTYDWDMMKKTDFEWWKHRLSQMENYFDAFRIDHILGFFRIWQIPSNQVEGIMGYLNPSIPLSVNEFLDRGVHFDYERFCTPFITDEFLNQLFGDDVDWVRRNCLYIKYGFAYRIKSEYDDQKKVLSLFRNGKITENIKNGLFDLISNVLLFEVKGSNGTQFYPRYGLVSVKSFSALDAKQKEVFNELYIDYYYRRQDAFWYESGLEKLTHLKSSTNMLICGEDLGMMTHCVTSVMKELNILSLEIQRAPKTNKKEFFHPADAPYLSVVTPSTHDMSDIRAWWEEDRGVSQRFYNNELGHFDAAPYFCEWWICRDIINMHLYSPAMWAIFQWQDLMALSPDLRRKNPNDERINVPSDSLHSWRYRMHLSLEELLNEDHFNGVIKSMIEQSGRS